MTWAIFSLVWVLAGPASLSAQLPQGVEDITDTLRIVPPWLPPSGNFRPWEAFHGQPFPFDFDNDGDLDLLLTAGPRPADSLSLGQNRFYRQDDSGWVDITTQSKLDSIPPASNAAVGDIDGDGY
ncbi:MAG: FG-GAP-like repeat-containing protein, partial [Candidatus Neomarinimicrobiota bacterium]